MTLRFSRVMKRLSLLFFLVAMLFPAVSYACTSFIVPGWATPDGRPLMWKHRDTGFLDNRLEHFKGEKYSFIGLVNSKEGPLGREVWIGSNTAGFSIMNTASYCLKDDDVPASDMDREGVLMYRALEICASLSDFEHFLDTLSRPMGIEANFGCIDAFGGAAYYEADNYGYIKRDVDAMPEGYCVVTNFSVNGRREDWKGVERYMTASSVMARQEKKGKRFVRMDHEFIMDSLSRSYEHQGDSLYIPRYITSASVTVQGARSGGTPDMQVIWAAVGYPDCAVSVPVPVTEEDHIPHYLKRSPESENCELCDLSLEVKKDIFPDGRDGGVDMAAAVLSRKSFAAAETYIRNDFNSLFLKYETCRMSRRTLLERYEEASEKYLKRIRRAHRSYVRMKK